MAVMRDHGAPPGARSGNLMMVEPFVQLRLSVLYDLDIRPIDLRVLMVLIDRSWQMGECDIPQPELAALCGRKQRQLQESLDRLLAAQLIEQHRWGPTQAKHYWPRDPEAPQRHTRKTACVFQDQGGHTRKTAPTHAENRVTHTRKSAPDTLLVNTGPEDRSNTPGATHPAAPPQPAVENIRKNIIRETIPAAPPPAPLPPDEPAPQTPATNARLGKVVDLIRAAGLTVTVNGRSGSALKASSATPEQVAACFVAIARGEYGDDFMRKRLNVHNVCNEYMDGFLSRSQGTRNLNAGRTGATSSRTGPIPDEILEDLARTMRY